jgi:ABC-type antimicrobial peptide transport system permease subunit
VAVDVRVRKVAADVAAARAGLVLAGLAVAIGSASLLAWQPNNPLLAAGVLLLALLGVVQTTAPLGQARRAERTLLRALGATDDLALVLAAVEGGLLGGLAAAIGLGASSAGAVLLGSSERVSAGLLSVWLVSTIAAGALSAALWSKSAEQ